MTGLGREIIRHHHVYRQHHLDVAGVGLGVELPGQIVGIRLRQRFSHVQPLRRQKRIGHAAADNEDVHLIDKVVDDPDLI